MQVIRRLRPDLWHRGLERRLPHPVDYSPGTSALAGPACLDDRRQGGGGDARLARSDRRARSTRRRCRGSVQVSGFSMMLQARGGQTRRGTGRSRRTVHRRPRSSGRRSAASRRRSPPRPPTTASRSTARRSRSSACLSTTCSRRCRPSSAATRSTTSRDSAATDKVTMQAESEFRAGRARPRDSCSCATSSGDDGAAGHADDGGAFLGRAIPAALQPVPHGRVQRFPGARCELRRRAARARGSRRRDVLPVGLRVRVDRPEPRRRSRPAIPPWSCSGFRSSSCSCSWPRSTRAGRCPSPCCSRRRSASWAR